MEFKGDEFIRNIEIEKEKAELEDKVKILEAEKVKTMNQEPKYFDDEPVIVDIQRGDSNHDLEDIVLDNNNHEETKKKYLILAGSLIVLFILTIVVIRLISTDKDEELFTEDKKVETIKHKQVLDVLDSEEEYQKLIDKKANKTVKKDLNIDAIVQEEIPVVATKTTKTKTTKKIEESDVFNMEKKKAKQASTKPKAIKPKPIKTKPVIAKAKIKPITIKPITKKPKLKKVIPANKAVGYYVQVGAFTQVPNKALLQKIKKAGYTYIIHKMKIKGTTYNKVLIGSYKDRKSIDAVINKIKKDLNKPSAYVLKLK